MKDMVDWGKKIEVKCLPQLLVVLSLWDDKGLFLSAQGQANGMLTQLDFHVCQ